MVVRGCYKVKGKGIRCTRVGLSINRVVIFHLVDQSCHLVGPGSRHYLRHYVFASSSPFVSISEISTEIFVSVQGNPIG